MNINKESKGWKERQAKRLTQAGRLPISRHDLTRKRAIGSGIPDTPRNRALLTHQSFKRLYVQAAKMHVNVFKFINDQLEPPLCYHIDFRRLYDIVRDIERKGGKVVTMWDNPTTEYIRSEHSFRLARKARGKESFINKVNHLTYEYNTATMDVEDYSDKLAEAIDRKEDCAAELLKYGVEV